MSGLSEPAVRLESFGRGDHNQSFVFRGFQSAIIAERPEDIRHAIGEVEKAGQRGLHAAGFVAYHAAPGLDHAFVVRDRDDDFPLLWFGLFEGREEVDPADSPDGILDEIPDWEPSLSRSDYDRDLSAIRSYITAGDSYQVNHTFRMSARLSGDRWALYRALCRSQNADYCAYVDTGRHQVLSASPELFFSLKKGCLTTRPMKGTHRRGRWVEEDDGFARELARSEKNRAENLMIVDLLRNDLGRVSETGSVSVSDLWNVEPYETLFQMTSTVESRLRPETGLTQLFEALFPCGSVTGAPKIRTKEIISELEAESRGIYTGSIGYVSPDGDAMFNVAIRTVAVENKSGRAVFGVGGGITWDSTSEDEYQECLTKARVLTERRPDFYLFETVRFDPGIGVFLLDRHLDRLTQSARYFGFPIDRDRLVGVLRELTEGCSETTRVKLILHSDGYISCETGAVSILNFDSYTASVSPVRVDSSDVFLYHKTSNRDIYDRCQQACSNVDDVILVNERDELTETRIGNLVLEIDGCLVTPPLDSGLLGGTFRAELVDRGEIQEGVLVIDDLQRAQNVFMVNSSGNGSRLRSGSQIRKRLCPKRPRPPGPPTQPYLRGLEMYRIGKLELSRIDALFRSKEIFRYGRAGECETFEGAWGKRLGVDNVRMTTSGTSALYAALVGLRCGPGDEVIVPACTYMATALAVLATGALPVVADVDESVTLSVKDVERRISPYTKVIIPVHMWGLACDMDGIMKLAKEHNILVLEDACQSVGGSYKERHLGSIGDAGAFSFNYYKNMTCGEGGAFVTKSKEVMDRASVAVDCCSYYWNPDEHKEDLQFAGLNFRATEVSGAILNAQLERIDDMLGTMHQHRDQLLEVGKSAGLEPIAYNSFQDGCGTHLGFIFGSEQDARAFSDRLKEQKVSDGILRKAKTGIRGFLPIDTGRHVYTRWDPIMKKQGAHHPDLNPYNLPANQKLEVEYSEDMCKDSLEILSRCVLVPMHCDNSDRKVDEIGKGIREAA